MHASGVNTGEGGAVAIGVIAVLCLPVEGGRGGGRVCCGDECKGYQGYDHMTLRLQKLSKVLTVRWLALTLWRYVWAEHLLFKVL
jgi:hypothetical protein